MPGEYSKLPQLPLSYNDQTNPLTPNNVSGKNWAIVDGLEYRKRPGLRPVFTLPDANEFAVTDDIWEKFAAGGVIAAGNYVVGNEPRTYNKYVNTVPLYPTNTFTVFNSNQIVTIVNGSPYIIRKVPLLAIVPPGAGPFYYTFQPDSTGQWYFIFRAAQSSYKVAVSATDTLATLATALTNLALSTYTLADTTATTQSNDLLRTKGFVDYYNTPAFALETTAGKVVDLSSTLFVLIYGYVLEQRQLSIPFVGGSFGGTESSYAVYTATTTPQAASTIQAVQFQDELLFAGQHDVLMSFDGYRISAAGCLEDVTVGLADAGAGGTLSVGTYTYTWRSKITKPSGQITYGPAQSSTIALAAGHKVALTTSLAVGKGLAGAYSLFTSTKYVPKRYNPLTVSATLFTTSVLTAPSAKYVHPGEYISVPHASGQARRYLVKETVLNTAALNDLGFATTETVAFNTTTGDTITLGETVEIYRTTAGGTLAYFVAELPIGQSFIDNTSDATLQTQASYVAKTYVIRRPPDYTMAACQHQNRIIVVGDYTQDGVAFNNNSLRSQLIKSVYWSQPNNEEFSTTDGVILDIINSDSLNSVYSFGGELYVGGSEALWCIQGDLGSALTYTVNRIANASGTLNNSTITALNNQLYAIGRNGLYSVAGSGSDYTIGDPINPFLRTLPQSTLSFARLTASARDGLLYVILPGVALSRPATNDTSSGQTFSLPPTYNVTEDPYASTVFVYNINTQSWTTWNGADFYVGGGLLDFDGKTWAFPHKAATPVCVFDPNWGYDGFSTPVNMRLEGPWQLADGDTFANKNWSRLRVLAAGGSSQNFTLTAKVEQNWNRNEAMQQADLSFRAAAGYGQVAYGGNNTYGDGNITHQMVPLTNQKALSVRACFENSNPAEHPQISGWNFEVAEDRRHMKQD